MRRTVMALPEDRPMPKASTSKRKAPARSRRGKKQEDEEPEEETSSTFPVVITTYDIIMRDRIHLSKYNWGYIVVDEGHRLKNLNCKLMKEIKQYHSAGRMILTGTPLHVCGFLTIPSSLNLRVNRIIWPSCGLFLILSCPIFSTTLIRSKNCKSFPRSKARLSQKSSSFNLPELQNSLPTSQSSQIIASLHAILKPFLLRRLKVDVELNIPPKKEYVLYAPLSVRQREAYDRVLDGGLRKWLIEGGTQAEKNEAVPVQPEAPSDEFGQTGMSLRRRKGQKSYNVDGDDDEYFEKLERGEIDRTGIVRKLSREEEEAEQVRAGLEHQARKKGTLIKFTHLRVLLTGRCSVVQVNNMKLQNTIMQLRKVCSHPFLFDWPIDKKTLEPVLGEELVNASGKMMVLDRLLRELFQRKHKVLIFSQFTTMLDIIQVRWHKSVLHGKLTYRYATGLGCGVHEVGYLSN